MAPGAAPPIKSGAIDRDDNLEENEPPSNRFPDKTPTFPNPSSQRE